MHNPDANRDRRRRLIDNPISIQHMLNVDILQLDKLRALTPEDAFSADPEVAAAAYYPQSGMGRLAMLGVIARCGGGRPTLESLDGECDYE